MKDNPLQNYVDPLIQKQLSSSTLLNASAAALIAFIGVAVIIALFILGGTMISAQANAQQSDTHGAWAYTQIYIKRKIGTDVDHPFGGFRHVTPIGDNKYSVNSYFDTSNGRIYYNAQIEDVGRGWRMNQFKPRLSPN